MRRVLLPLFALVLFAGTMQSLVVLFRGRGFEAPRRAGFAPAPAVRAPVVQAPVAEPLQPPESIPVRSYPTPEESIAISEVEYHPASDDPLDEWIELHNRGDKAVEVGGWKLAEAVDFTIPAATRIPPGAYLLVCADRDRMRRAAGVDAVAGNWTGSLKDSGERIRLLTAEGKDADTLAYEDGPPFPGLSDGRGSSLERRNPHLPSSTPANWGPASTSGWVHVRARGEATTNRLYLYLDGPGLVYIDDLSLTSEGEGRNLIPDGGFEEGQRIWSFDGTHSGSRVTAEIARSGKRCLAIAARGAGSTRGTSVSAVIPGVTRGEVHELSFWAFFTRPIVPIVARFSGSKEASLGIHAIASPSSSTPGRANSIGAEHPPPLLHPLTHAPAQPAAGDEVVVTAGATSFRPVRDLTLIYDAGRGEKRAALEASGPPSSAGGVEQGTYSARIGPFLPGTLVRYRAEVKDGGGATGAFPPAGELPSALAFYVDDPTLIEPAGPGIAVYHFLMDPSAVADLDSNPQSDAYRRGIFMGDGKVHCDVRFRYRGQTSRWLPKRHVKVRFNKDKALRGLEPPHPRFRTINLNSGYGDKSFLREMLGFQLWRDMGEAYCETWHARAYLNGTYLGFYIAIENPNGDFLARNRLEEGWLWKSYSTGSSLGGFELEAGDPVRGNAMLASFLEGINTLEGESLEAFIRERMNVDSFINYLAGCQLIHQADHVAKNYLLYADPQGKFTMYPWDLDLTHGRNYECSGGGIWNDTIRHDMWDGEAGDEELLFGTRANPKCGDSWNEVIDAFLWKTHAFRPLYYRRIAEHLAHFYHPEVLVPRIEELREKLREEVARDRARWGAYGGDVDFDRQCDLLVRWVRRRFAHVESKLEKLGYPVGNAFSARFDSSARVGEAPLLVRFRSACIGSTESLEWDFGDGTKGAGASPEHSYEKPGTYDVRLRASGPEGAHEIVRRAWVRVKEVKVAKDASEGQRADAR